MTLRIGQESTPATPSAGKAEIFFDSADARVKAVVPSGAVQTLAATNALSNFLANGTFQFAQRQAPGTLTSYGTFAGGRKYAADRWGLTGENDSVQYRRVDSITTPETGLGARYYAELKKITSAGKVIMSQVVEGNDAALLRGRRVRVQFKAKNSVGSHTLRCALLYLTSAGTVDTIPGTFASAFGSIGVDPTWGTNISAIVPTLGSTYSTISGSAISSTLTSAWRQYGGVFVVPSSAQNVIVAIFTDAQMAANDIVHVGEVGLFDGDEERAVLTGDVHNELERCQRFCSKTFAIDTAPASNVGAATGEFRFQAVTAAATTQRSPSHQFPVRMRAAPTVSTFNPASSLLEVRDVNANANCSGTGVFNVSDRGCTIHTTGAATTAVGNALGIHLLYEAEL